MVTLASLWVPILVAAVLVFLTSSAVHMVLRYHARDYAKLPNEDGVRAALRQGNPEPRQYVIPYAGSMKEMGTPEMKQKYAEGPVAVLTLRRPGPFSMEPALAQWFGFTLVVSVFVAYVASRTLDPGAPFAQVFRVTATVAWLGYAGGAIPQSIWMGRPWSTTAKDVFDGLLYGIVTGLAFGWRW